MVDEKNPLECLSREKHLFREALCVGLSAMAFLGFALATRAKSWFYGDDYSAFYWLATKPFSEFLTTPVDVHFIPLHRFTLGLTQTVFPFDFDATLIVMGVFHLAGVWMLYRCLQLIHESAINAPLAALVGTSFYVAACLPSWTAGIARFGYIFFSTVAIHQYLKFRMAGGRLRVVAIVVCVLSASAFFSKGLLIPGYLLALEMALFPGTTRWKVARNLAVVSVVVLVAAIYYKVGIAFGTGQLPTPEFDWRTQKLAFEIVLAKFPQSFLGLWPPDPFPAANWLVVAIWSLLVAGSSRKDPFNLLVWMVGLVVVAVNFAVITLSQRMALGARLIVQDRYYFENFFLVALFLAIIARRSGLDAVLAKSNRSRVAVGAAWLAVCVLAVGSQASYLRALDSPRYSPYPISKAYGMRLRESMLDLRQSHQGTLHFADGVVPRAVLGFTAIQFGSYSRFLPTFDSDVSVSSAGRCLYTVLDDGSIRRPPAGCP